MLDTDLPLTRDELLALLELADAVGRAAPTAVPAEVLDWSRRLFVTLRQARIDSLIRKCNQPGTCLIMQ